MTDLYLPLIGLSPTVAEAANAAYAYVSPSGDTTGVSDSVALAAFLADTSTKPGRMMPGTYYTNAPLQVPANGIVIADGVTLKWGASPAGFENTAMLILAARSKVFWLKVDAAIVATNSYGVLLYGNGSGCTGVEVINADNVGINVYASTGVQLVNCLTSANYVGIQILQCARVFVENCISNGNLHEGLLVAQGAVSSDISIIGGEYSDNLDSGISIGAASKSGTITGAICERNAHSGIELQSAESWAVTGNVCRYNTQYGILVSKYSTGQSLNIVTTGNLVEFNGLHGVQVAGTSIFTVANNTVCNNSQAALGVSHGIVVAVTDGTACYKGLISGNIVTDLQGTKTQESGIYISAGAHIEVCARDNLNRGNHGADFVDGSTCASNGSYTGQDHRGNQVQPAVTIPAVPAAFAYTYNLNRQPVEVMLDGSAGAAHLYLGGPYDTQVDILAGPGTASFILKPGQFVAYTGTTPTWIWRSAA